jgi:Ca2+/Na+ antiporter
VEANSTGGQGARRAVAPSDDDDIRSISIHKLSYLSFFSFSSFMTFLSAGVATSINIHILLLLLLVVVVVVVVVKVIYH